MVKNDDAQEELVKQDVVPTVVKCATDTDFNASTVQQPALECLWTMVFMPEVLFILSQNSEFVAHLKTLLNTNSTMTDPKNREVLEKMRYIADGLLWEIIEKPKSLSKEILVKLFKYDIMISYQRADQPFCEALCDRLKHKNKFRVWFDERELHGQIVDHMSEAIEGSEFVLIVMSKKYQDSHYCRSEAIYASKLQRHIIPIKLHQDFQPRRWLGMTVADLFYVDFAKNSFDAAYEDLIKQIELNRRRESPGIYPLNSFKSLSF